MNILLSLAVAVVVERAEAVAVAALAGIGQQVVLRLPLVPLSLLRLAPVEQEQRLHTATSTAQMAEIQHSRASPQLEVVGVRLLTTQPDTLVLVVLVALAAAALNEVAPPVVRLPLLGRVTLAVLAL